MGWTFSWDSTSITLPVNPSKVTTKYAAQVSSELYPGDYPILISMGKQPLILTLEGLLTETGKTLEQLYTSYIEPLAGRVYQEVTVDADDSRYDGTYILSALTWEERGGVTRAIWYKMELRKGSTHVVV